MLKKFYGAGIKNVLERVNIALAGLELWLLPYCFGLRSDSGHAAIEQSQMMLPTPHRFRRESLAALAKTWTRLAAEFESDQALLRTLSDLEFNEPCYTMPSALNLRAA